MTPGRTDAPPAARTTTTGSGHEAEHPGLGGDERSENSVGRSGPCGGPGAASEPADPGPGDRGHQQDCWTP
eukprot:5764476-Heterocapsa_arctica.AAC.1